MNEFTAESPSPRYEALLLQYKQMHDDTISTGKVRYAGLASFGMMISYLREFLKPLGIRDLLDYGGGRGAQYGVENITADGVTYKNVREYIGVDDIECVDAGVDGAVPVRSQYDAVICIDVLEHCDRQDLPWIVEGLFRRARRAVFANIASYPARRILPNGENAHCTIEDVSWWEALFARAAANYPSVDYRVIYCRDYLQTQRVAFCR